MNVTTGILMLCALVFVFVLYKLNTAIKLMHNRINIVSSRQKSLMKELRGRMDLNMEEEFEHMDKELHAKLEKDFKS